MDEFIHDMSISNRNMENGNYVDMKMEFIIR